MFIIDHCSIRFIQAQDPSAVDVSCTKGAAGKVSVCPSASARPGPGEGGLGQHSLAAALPVVVCTVS